MTDIYAIKTEGGDLVPFGTEDAKEIAALKVGKIVRIEPKSIPKRTIEQNSAQHAWYREAYKQLRDQSAEDYRAYCKLEFGIPILCSESLEYETVYERILGIHDYETKIMAMRKPMDYSVTRLMTIEQKSRYLDEVFKFLTGRGVHLTEPGK